MLTSEQYETIGRLTIGFNTIDFLIGSYTTEYLGSAEWTLARLIANRERFFGQRREFLKDVLKVLAKYYPVLTSDIAPVSAAVNRAGLLNDKRNQVVHGFLVSDDKTGQVFLRHKRSERLWTQDELDELATEVRAVADRLAIDCWNLREALTKQRKLQILEMSADAVPPDHN